MDPYLHNFYNRWTEKASRMSNNDLDSVFDKYFTLFVIYNNLYNQIPSKLIAENKPIPDSLLGSDKKRASDVVLRALTPRSLSTSLQQNENDIQSIIQLLEDGDFYINLYYGERRRNEDLKLLEGLKSENTNKRIKSILLILYYVRCNLFHGHKSYHQAQTTLLEPLIHILETINSALFERLNQNHQNE